jgi:hypothetical protein
MAELQSKQMRDWRSLIQDRRKGKLFRQRSSRAAALRRCPALLRPGWPARIKGANYDSLARTPTVLQAALEHARRTGGESPSERRPLGSSRGAGGLLSSDGGASAPRHSMAAATLSSAGR